MLKDLPFNQNIARYEAWYDEHPLVYQTELAAIRKLWPEGDSLMSLEIGTGTGRFASELGIREGIDPLPGMCAAAESRGVRTTIGVAEDLPYQDGQFDVVLINFGICYFERPLQALKESFRVLKNGGVLILTFLDRESRIGTFYLAKQESSTFYRNARFFTPPEVQELLAEAGFDKISFYQTLFHDLEETRTVEECIPGHGKGSFVLAEALKN